MHQPRWKLKSKEVRPLIGEEVCEHLGGKWEEQAEAVATVRWVGSPVPFQSPRAMSEREGEESEERGEESLTGSLLRQWDFPGKILEWVAISYSRDESVLMSIPRLFSYQI